MKLAHKTVLEVLGVLIPGMIITIEVLALLAPAATLTSPRDEFAAALRARRGQLAALDMLRIEDPRLDIDAVVGQVWALIEDLPIVRNIARIVAATKTLHHVLPDLVVPMDRRWTGAFFWWSAVDPQSRQYQTFWLTYRDMITVARDVEPSQYVGDGWKTSLGKVIDNAVIGYCITHNISN